ncbi:MAG TPA: TIM barrel protein [Opitutaceae bacterium]|jgi:hydroxypyruvate isomerase|nr:TIM barrel protein [Opitutaceae bacterium]
MEISRRNAIKALASTAALAALPKMRADDAAPAPAKATTGSFDHSVCRWCYSKMPLEELAMNAKKIGIPSVELLEPSEWPVVQKQGLTCAMAMGVTKIPEGLNRLEHHAVMVPGMIERIGAVADAGLPNVIVFSGSRAGMPDEQGLENCAVALKQMMAAAEKRRVTVCMELLNSKINHPDYMCDHTAWGVELVKRVGSDRFKLLYDIYHMQIMEGDVVHTIRDNHQYIGHYHTGGVPGRHEIDDSQELNYPMIARAIRDTGFKGYLAQEFVPVRDPMTSLAAAVALCTV